MVRAGARRLARAVVAPAAQEIAQGEAHEAAVLERVRRTGLECQGTVIGVERVAIAPQLLEHVGAVVPGFGKIRRAVAGVHVVAQRRLALAARLGDAPEVVERAHVIGSEAQGDLVGRRSAIEIIPRGEGDAQIEMCLGDVGRESGGLTQDGHGLVDPPGALQGDAVVHLDVRGFPVERGGARECVERLGRVTERLQARRPAPSARARGAVRA